jgi:hypothetical protein
VSKMREPPVAQVRLRPVGLTMREVHPFFAQSCVRLFHTALRSPHASRYGPSLAGAFLLLGVSQAAAQELEPRAYSSAPIGTNFIGLTYTRLGGQVLTDPSLPVTDVHAEINSLSAGYVHVFDLAGHSVGRLRGALCQWQCVGKRVRRAESGPSRGPRGHALPVFSRSSRRPRAHPRRIRAPRTAHHCRRESYGHRADRAVRTGPSGQRREQPVGIQARGRHLATVRKLVCGSLSRRMGIYQQRRLSGQQATQPGAAWRAAAARRLSVSSGAVGGRRHGVLCRRCDGRQRYRQ